MEEGLFNKNQFFMAGVDWDEDEDPDIYEDPEGADWSEDDFDDDDEYEEEEE